ncbi:hypothetical protein NDU88_006239 [Pleurodeles waltl]|uniref:Uncharacterized protein n=1 Tax=Pleurodeles waltl TaxID=8319 RepID=A0AAV7ULV0_PLEWA|nr:hypothetical protein NDU88_006239 [Pleurodeles waltl]
MPDAVEEAMDVPGKEGRGPRPTQNGGDLGPIEEPREPGGLSKPTPGGGGLLKEVRSRPGPRNEQGLGRGLSIGPSRRSGGWRGSGSRHPVHLGRGQIGLGLPLGKPVGAPGAVVDPGPGQEVVKAPKDNTSCPPGRSVEAAGEDPGSRIRGVAPRI